MTTAHFLSARLRELFIDGTWIASTNYTAVLAGVPFEVAIQSPHGLNSMAALTFHMNYYLEGLIQVLQGGPLTISDRYSFDAPLLDNEADWQQRVQRFQSNAQLFIDLVERMDEPQWQQPFVSAQYGTWQRNIEGVLEHGYYHLGQMVLIKKLVLLPTSS